MTFEARDSAAKVVPTPRARAPSQRKMTTCRSSRRSTSSQTKWPEISPASDLLARRAITASFVQFSREFGTRPMGKSPSAPDLQAEPVPSPRLMYNASLLNPHVLLQRQALSVDNPDYNCFSPPNRGSQVSMALDLHLENPVTLRVRDKTRRSDTARRHMFVRQRPVEEDERSHSWSPRHYRDEYRSLSNPHSRRESMARTPRGSQEERPRSNSSESRKRKKSSSRSASERSQLTPEEQTKRLSEIIVIEPPENECD